ncbi:hypothetical protein GAO09_24930 [Rhizobiales bacterium RZME27]|uniref:Uncharacterized protein n=1 Tax=Endobacterium cereale TaxID=2663029 RepID=A0A6A8AD92_9HYPH|nr:hypothetical protein [Endobacterium cereale]MEB2847437.1 hypothetical protein [Endobacterium cereale]MQY49285.1 hypothetical protein [Endobacterium cereale]
MNALLAEMHPDRVALCFRTVGANGLPDGLMDEPRFATRLTEIVTCHYDLADTSESIDEVDQALALLSRDNLEKLAARAGVVLHARQFVQEIRGPVLSALTDRFGAEALDDARRHGALATDMARTDDLDELEAEVARDGTSCLAAWIEVLPVSLKRRVRLKWPNDHAVPAKDNADLVELGPVILRRLYASESRNA